MSIDTHTNLRVLISLIGLAGEDEEGREGYEWSQIESRDHRGYC